MPVAYELVDSTIRINALNWAIAPSIEDSEACMAVVIDILMKEKNAERIIIAETRENEYNFEQTRMLAEIADAYSKILNEEKLLSLEKLGSTDGERMVPQRLADLQFLIFEVLRKDPIGAYVKISSMIIQNRMNAEVTGNVDYTQYLENALFPMEKILAQCKLIQLAKPHLSKFRPGDRTLYREFFRPTIRPNFMLTRYMLTSPKNAQRIEGYTIGNGIDVDIFRVPGSVRYVYHISPPEFRLSEDKFILLDNARRYLAGHKPTETEFTDPEKTREVFFNIGKDLIKELSRTMNMPLTEPEVSELATILARYTAGFGILELLLSDEKIQDVYINSPIGVTPVYINHSDFEECETNLIPTKEDAEAWATRFRLYSGRPLDEANPVLDTEINVPGGRARVAAITRTLSPEGLAYAFRRHRERPWTFPLFMNTKYFDSLYAGLMSFIVDGGRALLIAGGRGSGKSSLLGSLMLEIMKKNRMIVQQDTLELPILHLRQLGYNIESLKSRSVITRVETELSADEALRTALRLGDSCLIVGEVRSLESVALFEAMRIGALANVVAGTIHGESAYGVFDRVVHDLGVVPTSFKALDLITICSQLRSPDGLHRFRRVTEVTEVRKKWKNDPMEENGFVNLMEYSAKEDRLKPTDTLVDGESEVLNEIAKRVRDWHGDWDAVWSNILLRGKIKQTMVDYAMKFERLDVLEADSVVDSNEMFHLISERVREEVGSMDSDMIYETWLGWFKNKMKVS